MIDITLEAEVAEAIAAGRAVVALESTVYSTLGLPAPANREALDACLEAVRGAGAVPAVTAVIDGRPRVGLDATDLDAVLTSDRKVAARDLPVAIAQGWPTGVTTVSASLRLASAAGVRVFATGGIGGVHRGSEQTADVSADLDAIAGFPGMTVSAGAKVFLDLPKTLERLETLGVTVLGYRTDEFPGFVTSRTGLAVPHRVESAAEAARVVAAADSGVLLAVPLPPDADLPREVVDDAIERALAEVGDVSGPEATPAILAAIAEASGGRSVPANVALVANNARVAAEVALSLADGEKLSR